MAFGGRNGRESRKSAIKEMEADYRPALEFFTKTLVSLNRPPDMSMTTENNDVGLK